MKYIARNLMAATALASLLGFAATAQPAFAQVTIQGTVPVYDVWQPDWDQYRYDKRHVVLGTVTDFSPYRLTVQRRNGNVMTIDLKNGTVIRPTGATPTMGQRAAVIGYWSNGTFIANRVVLRP